MVSKNNWVKEAQNLYTENYTILLQEIKEDLNKWKDILCSWIGRVKVVQKATAGSADSFGFLLNVFLLPSLITISPLQYISFQTLWFSSLHVRLGPFFFFFNIFHVSADCFHQWDAVRTNAFLCSGDSHLAVSSGSFSDEWSISSGGLISPLCLHTSNCWMERQTLWMLPCCLLDIFVFSIILSFVQGCTEVTWKHFCCCFNA